MRDISFVDAGSGAQIARSHRCNQVKVSIESGVVERKETRTRATQFFPGKTSLFRRKLLVTRVTRWRYIFRAGIDFRVCSRYFDFRDGAAVVDRNFLNSNHVGRLSLAPFSRPWDRDLSFLYPSPRDPDPPWRADVSIMKLRFPRAIVVPLERVIPQPEI